MGGGARNWLPTMAIKSVSVRGASQPRPLRNCTTEFVPCSASQRRPADKNSRSAPCSAALGMTSQVYVTRKSAAAMALRLL